jgi:DNA-binding NtrC family response regulator
MRRPQILVVDDEADIRELIREILTEEGYEVATAGNAAEAREAVRAQPPELVLLDIWMPDLDGISLLKEWQSGREVSCPVVMLSGHGTVETAMEATRLGAADFVEKPLSLAKLLRTVDKTLQGARPGRKSGARSTLPPVIAALGRSRRIRELRDQASQLAGHIAPVLVVGESGTGREALARYIHEAGPRRDQPFVVIAGGMLLADNAAQLLLGADTPRGREPGCFERAASGTLFITDIEEAAPEAQRLLLGILDQGAYTPLGRASPVALQARISASARPATVADPAAQGVRPELLGRLATLQVQVPPLRDYAQDISDLLQYFVDDVVERDNLGYRRFSFAAQNRLRNYPWPGNLRELAGLVQRLLAAGGPEEISLEEVEKALPPSDRARQPLVKQDLLALPLREAREEFERAYLTEQLALCAGKVGQLAKRVGMERTHLYRKLRSLGVEFKPAPGEE